MNLTATRVVAAVAVLAIAAGLFVMLRPEPVMVDAATVGVGPMRLTVDEEGKTRIRERYVISSPLTGRLRRVSLDPGDPVSAQQTPVVVIEPTAPELLDPRALAAAEARVRAAEAALDRADSLRKRAQAEYDYAEAELGRVLQAASEDAANPRELDEARTAERATSEALRAQTHEEQIARFELDLAQSALLYARGESPEPDAGRMTITSPIDGVVLRVFEESVTVVNPGEPLLEVGDPRDLEIVIDVLSADGVRIDPGDRVIIEHWGGDGPLEAQVRLVEPSAFTHISALGIEEQRVNVIADFVSPPERRASLGDQFRVEASIVIWSEEAVPQIPSSAVFRASESWAVFAVAEDRAELRRIDVGMRNGRVTQILQGLEVGERVVLHPSDKLRAGARVRLRDQDGEADQLNGR